MSVNEHKKLFVLKVSQNWKLIILRTNVYKYNVLVKKNERFIETYDVFLCKPTASLYFWVSFTSWSIKIKYPFSCQTHSLRGPSIF